MTPLQHCHRCSNCRKSTAAGVYLCAVDLRDIIEHARAGYCPAGKFGSSDPIAAFNARPRADEATIAALRDRDKLGGCGCKE